MQEKDKSRKTIIIVVIVALLAVISAMGAVIYRMANEPEETQAPERGGGSNTSLITDKSINEKAANATFTTDMNVIWTFESGNPTSTNAHIGNSELNQYDVYFEIFLDDETQEVLYTSPVIPVGKQLSELTLDKVLPDGNYGAICRYYLLDDEDSKQELGRVSFNVTLIFGRPQ